MLRNKKICCIITARKNSKGLKQKNFRKINNKPIFFYPIRAAKKSKYVDKIFFNSDCKSMCNKAKLYGANISFIRPKNLATSKTKSSKVLIHQIKKDNLEKQFDYLLLLEPTSPLTNSNDIDKAIKKLVYHSKKYTSLISVAKSTTPNSFLSFSVKGKKLYANNIKEFYTTRRQDFPKRVYIDGSLYLSSVKDFMIYKSFFQKNTTFITLEKFKNFQIDDFTDYEIVKFLMKKFR